MTGLQWIASEAWNLVDGLHTSAFIPYLGGTLGIAIQRGNIPGLRDFLLTMNPNQQNNTYEKSMVTTHSEDKMTQVTDS